MPSLTPSPAPSATSPLVAVLADGHLRRSLHEMIRRRVPPSEIEDLVQATLADALASERAPENPDDLRRWIFAIAKNKIADHYRRTGREEVRDIADVEAASAPHSARDLMRWAESALPDGEKAKETLDWMLREGHGEKLEAIAAEARVPAPQVRQRVSRLRRHLRERWALDLAALLVGITFALGLWYYETQRITVPIAKEAPSSFVPRASPLERATELRRVALERCDQSEWQGCLDALDQAKELDRDGDRDPRIDDARQRAADGLRPPTPAPAPSAPAPSSIAPPTRVPRPPVTTQPKAPPHRSLGSSM